MAYRNGPRISTEGAGVASLVHDLTDSSDASKVGGKAAALSSLKLAGLQIPAGFVIDSGCCRWSRHTERTIPLMPTVLRDEIAHAYADLRAPEDGTQLPLVAVRSSAVGEDSLDTSFAGQFVTTLALRGLDSVIAAVRECWASLWAARTSNYRVNGRVPCAPPAMAVLVQRQVRAKSAGVAFSLDPRNGDRSRIVIESAWGLGTSVVSGEEADLLVLEKADGREIERRIAAKPHAWYCATDQGLMRRPVPESQQYAPSITQEATGRIRDAVKLAMTVLDDQVDLEWALEETGELQVLQARPETVWTNSERPATSLAQLTSRVTTTMGGHEDVGS